MYGVTLTPALSRASEHPTPATQVYHAPTHALYMYMYICICIYVHIKFIYIYIYVNMYINSCEYTYRCIYVCSSHICIIHMIYISYNMYVYTYAHMYVCMYVCMIHTHKTPPRQQRGSAIPHQPRASGILFSRNSQSHRGLTRALQSSAHHTTPPTRVRILRISSHARQESDTQT